MHGFDDVVCDSEEEKTEEGNGEEEKTEECGCLVHYNAR